ncbi:hypothetical protein C8J56DRAFT_240234 [Mycena floridula]|nr:hypothetical protein C8J56DRAFT_240234 [Mycena floridula]
MVAICNLVDDVLLLVVDHMHLDTAIALTSTCKRLHAITEHRIFWITVLLKARKTRAIPLPALQDLAVLSLLDLKRAGRHFFRLERNWSLPEPKIVRPIQSFTLPQHSSIILIIPGTGLLVLCVQKEKIACWNVYSEQFVCEFAFKGMCTAGSPVHFDEGRCSFVLVGERSTIENIPQTLSVIRVEYGSSGTTMTQLWSHTMKRSSFLHSVLNGKHCVFAELSFNNLSEIIFLDAETGTVCSTLPNQPLNVCWSQIPKLFYLLTLNSSTTFDSCTFAANICVLQCTRSRWDVTN